MQQTVDERPPAAEKSGIKQIRLQEEVYHDLESFLRPRETFSDCVARLLRVCHTVQDAVQGLETSLSATNLEHLKRQLAARQREEG